MALLNYTTKITTAKTAAEVQQILAKAGASQVMLTYADGEASGLAFTTMTEFGPRSFVLPVNADPVLAVLRKDKVPRTLCTREHAARVGWRIVKDWIEAQLALIQTEMVTLDQVMLPYMTDETGTTVWTRYLDQGRLALPKGDEQHG